MSHRISDNATPFFRYYLFSVFVITNLVLVLGTFFFFPKKYQSDLLTFIPFWIPITSVCSYFLFHLRDVSFTEEHLIIKGREVKRINLTEIYRIRKFQNYYSIHYQETGGKKWVLVLSRSLGIPFSTGDVKSILELKKAINKASKLI